MEQKNLECPWFYGIKAKILLRLYSEGQKTSRLCNQHAIEEVVARPSWPYLYFV